MKTIVLFLVGIILVSCDTKPEPLVYGKDACHACKMTLVDNRFGAELLTKKGKVFKFDDVNCLVGFYKSGFVPRSEVHSVLVVDYSKSSDLIDATKASYFISGEVRSPMGSNAAVFAQRKDAEALGEKSNGDILDWSGVLAEF